MAKIIFGVTPALSQLTSIAKEKQLFRKHGLDIDFRKFLTDRKAMQALQKGWLDVANLIDANVAALALERKIRIRLLACTQIRRDGTILARADRGVTSPQSLCGKRVGYMKGTSSHMFILYFCRHYGLDMETLDLVQIRTDQMESALIRGDIDACSLWQPFIANTRLAAAQADLPLTVLNNENFFKSYVALGANTKALNKKREDIAAVIKALEEASSWAAAKRDEAADIIAASFGLPLPLFQQMHHDTDTALSPVAPDFWDQVKQQTAWLTPDPKIDYEKFIDTLTDLD